MRKDIEPKKWANYLTEYARRNDGRPTRLEVIADAHSEDFWLECGLPLTGIDADTHGKDVSVEIMLGGRSARESEQHVTRNIAHVRRVTPETSDDGRDLGLEIENAEAVTTILRFEGPVA